jgi:hypothetical protein
MTKNPESGGTYRDPQIQWDEERDEPFCNVEIKGQEYRMTMWRESDGDDMVGSDLLRVE